MTDQTTPDPETERIRATAAAWIVRLEHRQSPRLERNLERWLAADPRHTLAYRRMTQRFEGARVLRGSQRYAARPPAARRRSVSTMAAAAALTVVALALILLLPRFQQSLPSAGIDRSRTAVAVGASRFVAQGRRIAAPATSINAVGLEDGSVVTLDSASAVQVAFAHDARHVTLLRGRARFEVAHDGRPFTVFAGGGSVTARGTIFDVALSPQGRVAVILIRGSVDVVPSAASTSPRRDDVLVRRLAPGETTDYVSGTLLGASAATPTADPQWSDHAVDFDNVSLRYLLERGNQGAGPPITVSDPALQQLRVSGRFDLADRKRLARNLATLFDLHVDMRRNAIEIRR
ncbi:FecR family protein [Sphingomonas sp. PL20]|uniref:FecR family protein n=1 Tax=Sphingomonas sp. PL20 TaxID=2760712 RepID=UPI002FF3F21A